MLDNCISMIVCITMSLLSTPKEFLEKILNSSGPATLTQGHLGYIPKVGLGGTYSQGTINK